MNILTLLRLLKEVPAGTIFKSGFHEPHSYRGNYIEPSVAHCKDVPVKDMIDCLMTLMIEEFGGYKGGEFTYTGFNSLYLSDWGEASEEIISGIFIDGNGYHIETTHERGVFL